MSTAELRRLMHPAHAGRMLGVNETARIMGVSQRVMRRWIAGKDAPSQESLNKLREYLEENK